MNLHVSLFLKLKKITDTQISTFSDSLIKTHIPQYALWVFPKYSGHIPHYVLREFPK